MPLKKQLIPGNTEDTWTWFMAAGAASTKSRPGKLEDNRAGFFNKQKEGRESTIGHRVGEHM